MAKHNEIGETGERLASDFLIARDYQILERNWRYSRAEIDIIAKKEDILIFVEVKTRSSIQFGKPEEFISKQKEKLILDAAYEYMKQTDYAWEIRFDFISILYNPEGQSKIEHFEDAFH